jgi:hypothetical protein
MAEPDGAPKKVRIGPLDYEVRWEDEPWRRTARGIAAEDELYQILHLPSCVPPTGIACLFLHEVMHSILWTDGNRTTLDQEQVCDCVGYHLTDFWRDNPEAFEWWIGLVKGGGNV